jgi:membrane protease YdiL (CAAX protease family)
MKRVLDRFSENPSIHAAQFVLVVILFIIEYVIVYISESIGILLVLISLLVIYGLLSVLNVSEPLSKIVEDVSLLFIYIMLMSALPWFFFRQELLVPAVYSLVLALCFWRIHSEDISLEGVGFIAVKVKNVLISGMVYGVPMGVIEYMILKPPAVTPTFELSYFLQTVVNMVFFVALGEEILFRALIQNSLIKALDIESGIFWASMYFSVMHFVWRSLPELVFTFVGGVILGMVYHKRRNLLEPVIIHAINNVILLAVMPYL